MAYEYATVIPYGITGRAGTMTAFLLDLTLTPVGSQPAFTITEGPGGLYLLYTAAMPDGHRGGIKVLDSLLPTWAFLEPVMPQWYENLDAKVSAAATLVVPAAVLAAVLVGQDLTLHRGDSLVIVIGSLPALTGATKVWFTLKKHHADTDAAALVQIDLTGLLRLNGAAGTLAQGSLTVDTVAAPGQVTVRLAAAASAQLVPSGGLYWDLQMLSGGQVTTLTEGRARVAADVTEAVS